MSQRDDIPYHFDPRVPIQEVRPGSTIFVAGPAMSPARDLALSLATSGGDVGDGSALVSTNTRSEKLLARCERASAGFDPTRTTVIDCSSGEGGTTSSGATIEKLSGPGDLTGMGIKLSTTYQRLHGEGITRVRTGILSVSTLLMYTDVRTVFRFLHTLSGRISALGGLGIFFIDPQSHDTKSTNMLTQVSDGRIDVREATGDAADGELRVRGLPDQSRDWQPFTLGQEVDQ